MTEEVRSVSRTGYIPLSGISAVPLLGDASKVAAGGAGTGTQRPVLRGGLLKALEPQDSREKPRACWPVNKPSETFTLETRAVQRRGAFPSSEPDLRIWISETFSKLRALGGAGQSGFLHAVVTKHGFRTDSRSHPAGPWFAENGPHTNTPSTPGGLSSQGETARTSAPPSSAVSVSVASPAATAAGALRGEQRLFAQTDGATSGPSTRRPA